MKENKPEIYLCLKYLADESKAKFSLAVSTPSLRTTHAQDVFGLMKGQLRTMANDTVRSTPGASITTKEDHLLGLLGLCLPYLPYLLCDPHDREARDRDQLAVIHAALSQLFGVFHPLLPQPQFEVFQ
jgi:hypothetical protein